jgi:hypothetical protein
MNITITGEDIVMCIFLIGIFTVSVVAICKIIK